MTKPTNVLYIYGQSDHWVARNCTLEDAEGVEEHIITESAPKDPKLGGCVKW